MACIRAFRGLRYDVSKVKMDDVVAPPYDIISPTEAQRLRERNRFNVVHVDLPTSTDGAGCYTRAGERFDFWCNSGVLVRDHEPSFYLITDCFELEGRTYERTGITAAVRLEPFGAGSIYPHEGTLAGPKVDRLRLMATTGANLSSILGMYPDDDAQVHLLMQEYLNQPPLVEGTGPTGAFAVRRISAPALVARVEQLFKERPIIIADGHHRYETALAYRNTAAGTGNYPAAFVMMHLVAVQDASVKVLPTHRLVRAGVGPGAFEVVEALKKDFNVREVTGKGIPAPAPADGPTGTFVLYAQRRSWQFSLKGSVGPADIDANASEDWCRLDVAILQKRVLEPILGVTADKLRSGDMVGYSHDAGESAGMVDSGEYGLAFLLRPTPVPAIAAVARNLEKMPPKSTYFYPKLVTGLVLRRLGQG